MRRTLIMCALALCTLVGLSALDFTLTDGSSISGEIQGSVGFRASFGALSLEGTSIASIALGSPSRIELSDGSVLVGTLTDSSFSVKWKYGTAVIELSKIASIGGTAAAIGVQAPSGGATATPATGAAKATNVGGIDFVAIPTGEFSMGDSAGGGRGNERPVHKVSLEGFRISKHEITLKQFKAFILDTAYMAQGKWKGDGEDCPVVNVSWEDANAFCIWFGRKYGLSARLPTEAEWEYAARGGQAGKAYPNGDGISTIDANYSSKGTRKVGSFPPNGYGLYDMAGNVWEWCQDWYGENYYTSSPAKNPKGPTSGSIRVLRGGSWHRDASSLRVAERNADSPGYSSDGFGFRLALPPSP